MKKIAVVTLDEREYTIPALNLDQLQECSQFIGGPDPTSRGFDILKIALRRAAPQPDFETFAPTLDEIGNAIALILQMSGLAKKATTENPTGLKLVETS